MISVSGTNSATLNYDPYGRLYEVVSGAQTTRFVYDGDALVMELDGANNLLRRYMHAPGVDQPLIWYEGTLLGDPRRRYLLPDRQGSIMAVATSSTTPPLINTYDAYGIPSSGNSGRFSYTGQAWLPEIGLMYYKARMYNPHLGRFMQTDPIGYDDQMNLYAYVGNDPMNATDPNGRERLGIFARGELAYKAGARVQVDLSFDTESFEVNLGVKVGAGVGARVGVAVGGFAEPSQTNGNSISGELSVQAGVAVDLNPAPVGGELSGKLTLVKGAASTANGFTGDALVPENTSSGSVGPFSVSSDRVEVALGADAGVSATVDVDAGLSLSLKPIVDFFSGEDKLE